MIDVQIALQAEREAGRTMSVLEEIQYYVQDPSKPAIKKHHSLVLRCESASEKYAWLARLKYVSETPPTERPVRKYTSRELEESRVGVDKTSSKKEKRDGRPPKVELAHHPLQM